VPSAFPPTPRRRWLWAAPVVLGGLAWGAVTLSNSLRGDLQATDATAAAALTVRPIVAFGHVDVDGGLIRLTPAVPGGRVADLFVKEGEIVPAGSVLLRLDDTQARRKVDEAKAAVDEAKAALDRGRLLPQQHEIKLQQAQSAVKAAEAQRNAVKLALERKQQLARINQLGEQDIAIAREELTAAGNQLEIRQDDLRQLRLADPRTEVRVLETQVARAEALRAQAQAALKEYTLVAPAAGAVLQLNVGVGDTAGGAMPAIVFCPDGPRVVVADVEQAFAALVAVGQRVTIKDDTHAAGIWTGRVERVADWYTNQRPVMPDPNQYADVRSLRCVIELDPDQPRLRINQRVLVEIQVPVK
jgi:multidrug resistance efflux pump